MSFIERRQAEMNRKKQLDRLPSYTEQLKHTLLQCRVKGLEESEIEYRYQRLKKAERIEEETSITSKRKNRIIDTKI